MSSHRASVIVAFHAHAEHQVVLFHDLRQLINWDSCVVKLTTFSSVQHANSWIGMKQSLRNFRHLLNHALLGKFLFIAKPLSRVCYKINFEMRVERGSFLFLNE